MPVPVYACDRGAGISTGRTGWGSGDLQLRRALSPCLDRALTSGGHRNPAGDEACARGLPAIGGRVQGERVGAWRRVCQRVGGDPEPDRTRRRVGRQARGPHRRSRGGRIRTCDFADPNRARYQASLRPVRAFYVRPLQYALRNRRHHPDRACGDLLLSLVPPLSTHGSLAQERVPRHRLRHADVVRRHLRPSRPAAAPGEDRIRLRSSDPGGFRRPVAPA